jgi:WD40 repeat protein
LDRLQVDYYDLNQEAVFIEIPYLKGNRNSSNASPLVTVSSSGGVQIFHWLPYDRHKSKANSFTIEKVAGNPPSLTLGPLHPTIRLNAKLIAVSPDGKTLIGAGFWDNTIRSFRLGSPGPFLTSAVVAHCDLVTCIAIDILGIYLVSGSQDTTCKVWELTANNTLPVKPLHTLYGHDSFISDVGISVELDMVVTTSLNAIINVYTLKEGIYLRTLDVYQPINRVLISYLGHVIVQSGARDVDVFSINGSHLCHLRRDSGHDPSFLPTGVGSGISSSPFPRKSHIESMVVAEDHLFIADSSGLLRIYDIFGLKLVNRLLLEAGVKYMAIVGQSHYSHIVVSLENSKLAIVTPDF